jgi:hypothetical protein
MIRRLFALCALALTATACTERLTTPGTCPSLCPGGEVTVRDTVIDVTFASDSSLGGFNGPTDATSLLLSTGPALGESRAVVRFLGRGDSLFVRDTVRTFTLDSAEIVVYLTQRDTTVSGMILDVFRLPRTIDTLATVAEVDAQFTPDALLFSLPINDSIRSGPIPIPFQGANLAKVAFTPADSTQLVIGLRLRAPGSGAAKVGALRSGALAAAFVSYVDIGVTDTTIRKQSIARSPARDFTVRPPTADPGANVITIGGFPSKRAFMRFALPTFLRDSATIIRATLELDGVAPVAGLPGDSVRIDVRGLLADFGLKSPIVGDRGATTYMRNGDRNLSVDIASLVTLWQGAAPLPAALRLEVGNEWSSFLQPAFHSSQSANGGARIRITYRPPFPFQGF